MIKVLEHGKKKVYSGRCNKCGCKFTCHEEDLFTVRNACHCPDCGHDVDMLYLTEEEIDQPPFGTTKDSMSVEDLNKRFNDVFKDYYTSTGTPLNITYDGTSVNTTEIKKMNNHIGTIGFSDSPCKDD